MTDTSTAAAVFDWDSPPPVGGTEHALWLAHWHFQFENPEQLHMLEQLYHDDIVWEVPSRRVIHHGKREVLENYARIFESCAEPKIEPVERYATAQRVFDDLEMTFKLVDSKGFPNHAAGWHPGCDAGGAQLPHSGRLDHSREWLRDLAP